MGSKRSFTEKRGLRTPKNAVKRAAAVGGAAVIGLTLFSNPAHAARAECYVPQFGSSCTSGVIPANTTNHNIYYSVRGGLWCASADIEIRDANNHAIVKAFHVGSGVRSGYVPGDGDAPGGLWGSYYLRVFNSCGGGGGKIEN